jgi:hypothetical protein
MMNPVVEPAWQTWTMYMRFRFRRSVPTMLILIAGSVTRLEKRHSVSTIAGLINEPSHMISKNYEYGLM